MAQINFTLDYDFLVGLFSKNPQIAFGKPFEKAPCLLLQNCYKTVSFVIYSFLRNRI